MQDIDNKTFIKRYDKLLLLVAESLPSIGSQVQKAIDNRPSVLEGYAILSNFASQVFAATAMAEQYLAQKLWTSSPSRLKADEWNYGMILHFVNDLTMQKQMPQTWQALLLKAETMKHPEPAVQHLEARFVQKEIDVNERTNFPLSFNLMVEDLALVLREIYVSSHPGHQAGADVSTPLLHEAIGYSFSKVPNDLIQEQSDSIANFGTRLDELQQYGIWQFVSTYLLTLCCEMEVTLQAMRHPIEPIDFDLLIEAAESLPDDPLKQLSERLDWLDNAYLAICNTPNDADIPAAIQHSPFPLTPTDHQWALTATAPANGLLRTVIGTYRELAEAFIKELQRLIKEA